MQLSRAIEEEVINLKCIAARFEGLSSQYPEFRQVLEPLADSAHSLAGAAELVARMVETPGSKAAGAPGSL